MGGTQSTPSTTDLPTVLNFILQEMFRRVDLADIYSLADPDRCKRYVIVATNAIDSLFIKMRIYPNKTKDGTLYLQSMDGLLKSMPADVRAKQREYCLEVSFLFIRILQSFGALFLSMYDDRMPITDPSTDVGSESPAKGVAFLNPKDFLGFSNPPPQASSSWFGSGGDLRSNRREDFGFYINDTSPYTILNHHITRPTSAADMSFSRPMRFDKDFPFAIAQDQLYEPVTSGGITIRRLKNPLLPTIIYNLFRNNDFYPIAAKLHIENPASNNYKVWLTNFVFTSNNINGKTFSESTTSEAAILGPYPLDDIPRTVSDSPYKKNITLPEVLKMMFDKVVISLVGAPPFSVAKYLRKINYVRGDNDTDQKIGDSNVYLLKGQADESTVKITYQNKIKAQGSDKLIVIQIKNVRMTITKNSDTSLQMSFRVSLDYTLCDVIPSEYRSILNIPAANNMTFKANSEDTKPTSDTNNLSIPEWLEGVFKKITSSTYQDGIKGLKITRAGLVEPYDSAGIRDELKVKKLWQAMAKDPPIKSHCVARAAQLLSLEALKGNLSQQAYTSICRTTFAYQKDGSLPMPGKPVVEESGIYALSLLFFEGLENGAPKILDPSAYKEYLRYLKYLFERYPSIDKIKDVPTAPGAVPDPDAIPSRLSDIREKSLKMCENRLDARLTLPGALTRNLYTVTQNLFSQQRAHFKEALTLIFSLFDRNAIEREKKLKFNPRILAGGMPEINNIAAKTRSLLLNYYKGCELTYRDGLLMIYNYEKSNGPLVSSDVRSGAPTVTRPVTQNDPTLQNNNNNDSR
jgi:hypothetical protein